MLSFFLKHGKLPIVMKKLQLRRFCLCIPLMGLICVLGSIAQAQPSLDITKILVDPAGGVAPVGDTVVFEIILENTGTTTIHSLPLTDTYDPDCLQFIAAVPTEDVETPGFIYWTNVGSLSPGGHDTIEVMFRAMFPCGFTFDSTSACEAVDEFGDPVPSEDGIAGVFIVRPKLDVTKMLIDPAGGTALVSDTVVFQVVIENTGTTDIDNVPLIDTFDPTCLGYLSATPTPNKILSGLLIWCCLGPIDAGESDTVTLYFSADNPCGMTIDTARTSGVSDEYGFSVPDDEDIAIVDIVQPGLEMTKSHVYPPGGKVDLGDTAFFEIVLHNTGTTDITILPLTDTYASVCLSYGWSYPLPDGVIDGELQWTNLGPLVSGGYDTVWVGLIADSLCEMTIDTAVVTGAEDEYGFPLAGLFDTAMVEIVQGNLSVTKTRVAPASAYLAVGDTVTFEIILENTGTAVIDSLPLNDTYDSACLDYVSADPVEDSQGPGLISWIDLGPLAVGGRDTVLLSFQAIDSCGVTIDTAVVSGALDEARATLPDQQDTAFVHLVQLDLHVMKSRYSPPGIASYGDTVSFLIILINAGSSMMTTLPLTDRYDPSCLEFLYADPVQDSQGSGWIAWNNRGPLAGFSTEDSIFVHFRAVGPCSVAIDTAEVSGAVDEFALLHPDNQDTASVDIQTPMFDVFKWDELYGDSDGNSVPSPGDTLRYTVILTNIGNDSATGVAFVDTPGVNTTLDTTSVTTASGTIVSGDSFGDDSVKVDVGTMETGASDTITFRVIIDNPVPAGVTSVANQGFVTSNELPDEPTDDPDTAPDNDSTYTDLATDPDLEITKDDTLVGDISPLGYVNPGDAIEYEVILSNSGNIGVSGVAFTDTPDVNTSLIVGSVTTTQGSIFLGNSPGDAIVWVSIGTIAGGGIRDTVTFQVTIDAPFPYGEDEVQDQGWAHCNELPTEPSDDPNTGSADDATVTAVVLPDFEVTKIDSHYADADGNGVLSPLDTMQYEIMIANLDSFDTFNVALIDTPGAHISLVPGSVTTTHGSVILGNFAWNWYIYVAVDTLTLSDTMRVTFLATVDCLCPLPLGGVSLSNQGWLSSAMLHGQPSDDPQTPTADDPTLTPMNGYEMYISGHIIYYSNSEPVPDAIVSLSGDGAGLTSTDENGEYRLSSLLIPDLCACNDYTVTPSKVNNACGAVTDFDESLVMRYVTGKDTLSFLQLIAADVSGNGSVTMWDAALIGQYSIGFIHTFPAGDWVFIPSSISYTALDSVRTGTDFIGILLGDVSGGWAPCTEIPDVSVSPLSLDMTLTEGEVGYESFFVCNDGPGVLSYTIDEASPVSWLAEFPTSDSTIAYTCDTIVVTFDATSLTAGDYYTNILVDSDDPDEPQVVVSVHLEVEPGIPDITVIPILFEKSLTEGVSALDTLHVCNDGEGSLDFSVSDGATWLGESPTNGVVGAGLCQEVFITFNAASLTPGDYDSEIIITSNDPDEPEVHVAVNLHVLEIYEPDINVGLMSFNKTLSEGGITSDDMVISNEGNAVLSYCISEAGAFRGFTGEEADDMSIEKGSGNEICTDDIPWLLEYPTSGSVSAGDEALIDVSFDATSLTAGNYYATIVIHSNDPDEEVVTVSVHLNVYSPGPCSPLGDVDGNGEINILDVVLLANIILEVHTPTSDELCRAECNQDFDINVLDMVAIINVILDLGTCPPSPGAKVLPHTTSFKIPTVMNAKGSHFVLPVSVRNDVDLRGIQLTIHYDASELVLNQVRATSRTEFMTVASHDMIGQATILIYSLEGYTLPVGAGPVVTFPFDVVGGGVVSRTVNLVIEKSILAVNCTEAVIIDEQPVSVKIGSYKPQDFTLFQNYPNPFNPITSVRYALPEPARVRVEVYDLLGQLIEVLVDVQQDTGYHTVTWDASNVASGVYFYRLTAGRFTQTKRMVLMK